MIRLSFRPTDHRTVYCSEVANVSILIIMASWRKALLMLDYTHLPNTLFTDIDTTDQLTSQFVRSWIHVYFIIFFSLIECDLMQIYGTQHNHPVLTSNSDNETVKFIVTHLLNKNYL